MPILSEDMWQRRIQRDVKDVKQWMLKMDLRLDRMEKALETQSSSLSEHVNDEMHDFKTIKAHIAEIVDLMRNV